MQFQNDEQLCADITHVRALVKEMLANQNSLNEKAYNTEWLAKGSTREFNYPVAASQEIAEFINSFWLPWWSKAEQDMANCRIELVDALHFLLSEAIIQFEGDLSQAEDFIMESFEIAMDVLESQIELPPTLEIARMLQSSINADLDSVFSDLFLLSHSIDFDIEKMHALYMGKSILNKFRQDNGYKSGTYIKKWDGVNEDNHFLSVWIAEQTSALTGDEVRAFLDSTYKKFTAK